MFDEEQFFRNTQSGEFFVASSGSRRGYTFRDRLKALKRKALAEKLTVYFVSLTLSSSHMDVESKNLHKFLMWLKARFKARGCKLYYAWVLEYQLKRYERSGDLVRHWHLAIAVPFCSLPNVRYVQHAVRHYQVVSQGLVVSTGELLRFWGYGQCLCVLARGSLAGYLGKYLEKNLEVGSPGARMFSSSIMRWWSFPAWAFGIIQECFSAGLDIVRARLAKGENGRELQLAVSDGIELNRLVVCSPWLRVAI